MVRRSYEEFRTLDAHLHQCIYDRRYSQLLPLLAPSEIGDKLEVSKLLSLPEQGCRWWADSVHSECWWCFQGFSVTYWLRLFIVLFTAVQFHWVLMPSTPCRTFGFIWILYWSWSLRSSRPDQHSVFCRCSILCCPSTWVVFPWLWTTSSTVGPCSLGWRCGHSLEICWQLIYRDIIVAGFCFPCRLTTMATGFCWKRKRRWTSPPLLPPTSSSGTQRRPVMRSLSRWVLAT